MGAESRSGGAEEQRSGSRRGRSVDRSPAPAQRRTDSHLSSLLPLTPPTSSPRRWSGPAARRRRRLHQTFITLSFYHSEKQTEAPLCFRLLSLSLSSFFASFLPSFLPSSPFPPHSPPFISFLSLFCLSWATPTPLPLAESLNNKWETRSHIQTGFDRDSVYSTFRGSES